MLVNEYTELAVLPADLTEYVGWTLQGASSQQGIIWGRISEVVIESRGAVVTFARAVKDRGEWRTVSDSAVISIVAPSVTFPYPDRVTVGRTDKVTRS